MILFEIGDKIKSREHKLRTIKFIDGAGFIEFEDGRHVHRTHLSYLIKAGYIGILKRTSVTPVPAISEPDFPSWPHPVFPC